MIVKTLRARRKLRAAKRYLKGSTLRWQRQHCEFPDKCGGPDGQPICEACIEERHKRIQIREEIQRMWPRGRE